MWEKEREELLQDYRYRKNILQEITLDDIEKWNNIDVDVGWDDILNKPTTLEGYGITEELNSRYLNVEDGEVKNTSRLKWVGTFGEISSNYNGGMDYAKLSLMNGSLLLSAEVYDNENKRVLRYSNLDVGDGIKLFSQRGVILGNNTTLYTGTRGLNDDESNLFPIVQQDNGNLLFGSTKIPNKMNNTLKLPRVNLYNDSNVYEGSLENDTYNIKGVLHDGLRLRHADGKYLMIGHTDNEANKVYSYMICDVDGVLKNESDGDDWAPIRFEQDAFFRHGLRISSGEPLIINNYNVATKIANLEKAITTGTGMVEWSNVLNKKILTVTKLQSLWDSVEV